MLCYVQAIFAVTVNVNRAVLKHGRIPNWVINNAKTNVADNQQNPQTIFEKQLSATFY